MTNVRIRIALEIWADMHTHAGLWQSWVCFRRLRDCHKRINMGKRQGNVAWPEEVFFCLGFFTCFTCWTRGIWLPPRCAALFCTLPFDWSLLWFTALLLCCGLREVFLGLLIFLDNLVILSCKSPTAPTFIYAIAIVKQCTDLNGFNKMTWYDMMYGC